MFSLQLQQVIELERQLFQELSINLPFLFFSSLFTHKCLLFSSKKIFLLFLHMALHTIRIIYLFSDWLRPKRTIGLSRCSTKKVAYFQLCSHGTSNKAKTFYCVILLIYAIVWAVRSGRRPKLPKWNAAFKLC